MAYESDKQAYQLDPATVINDSTIFFVSQDGEILYRATRSQLGLAEDADVVHKTGNENIAGVKTLIGNLWYLSENWFLQGKIPLVDSAGVQIVIQAGEAKGENAGGIASLNAGSGDSAAISSAGGDAQMVGGPGYGLGTGGNVNAFAGSANGDANGGNFYARAGQSGPLGGLAGEAIIEGGTAGFTDTNGGDVILKGGASNGAGTFGRVQIQTRADFGARFNADAVTEDRNISIPNASGVMLLDTTAAEYFVPYVGATQALNLGFFNLELGASAGITFGRDTADRVDIFAAQNHLLGFSGSGGVATFNFESITGTKNFVLPDQSGTFALLSDLQVYTNEEAQDAVGNILTNSSEIAFTYNDVTPSITASIIAASIDESKLDASVNASLDLADSAVQDLGDLGITASSTEINYLVGVTSSIQTQINGKQNLLGFTPENSANKGQANGYASLDGSGKVPTSQLPALALTDVYVVASQVAQLALTAEEGDVAVRTDLNKSYIHNGGTSGTMADWQELLTPTDSVLSVNGMTGVVTLTTTHINEGTNLYFTDERAQDAVGSMVDSTLVYVDATPLLSRAALTGAITAAQGSNTTALGSFTKAHLDAAVSDGNILYVGDITQYTDEMAQDAIGTILVDSAEIDFTYNDGVPSITASLIAGSIDETKLDASVNASLDLADSAVQNLADLGITATATEINYITNVTSDVQAQLDVKQPLDADLTAIAGLTPNNDDFIQRKAGAWTNRSVAQVKTDLGLTGTNSGDQNLFGTISVAGQSDVVADSTTDILTLVAGAGITITTNAGTDTVTFTASSAGISRIVEVSSGAFTAGDVVATDYVYHIVGNHPVTMPPISSKTNRYTIKNRHTAPITITADGAETIDGDNSITVLPNNSVDLVSDKVSEWSVV